MTKNECAKPFRPFNWIFEGKWALWFLGAFMMTFLGFFILVRCGIDPVTSVILSCPPVAVLTGYVLVFVRGKAPSYAQDWARFWGWKLEETLYLRGWIDRIPRFEYERVKARRPRR